MFEVLVMQSLYSLSDAQMEFQIRDRFSFRRFLGLTPDDTTPDEKTIWLFRQMMTEKKVLEKAFEAFNRFWTKLDTKRKRG
jgi:IS5 family transposase